LQLSNEISPYLRSYGRKKGRAFGESKQRYLDLASQKYCFDNTETYGSREPYLEIGFGSGEHMVGVAQANPECVVIGCEPYLDGVSKAVELAEKDSVDNIRIYIGDVRDIIHTIPDAALAQVFILFPDPWPKKKHHKKRLVNHQTLDLLKPKMKVGAKLLLATDHVDYAAWMLEVMAARSDFESTAISQADLHIPPSGWVNTKYELKAIAAGLNPVYLEYSHSN